MKFMKLGSKPDQFKTDGDNVRYVATELATDLIISVGDTKFYLHKFPLLSKSSRLQRLVYGRSDEYDNEINIHDIPGGPGAFEICAKYCYGMIVTLNAYNVVAARCAAEYLEMYETIEKGNIIYKIDVFLTSTIFRSWKDSIIVLQTAKSFLPWSEELKIISHCLDAIAIKASIDPSKVDWSYTYNRKKILSENGNDTQWNGLKKHPTVPNDWWVEDLCELQIDLYKRVITTIRANGKIAADIIGESLKSYALSRLPSFSKGTTQGGDLEKYKYLIETIISLLPEKSCGPCSFLLKLLEASIILECGETVRRELMQRIGQKLDEATVGDILWQSTTGETTLYSIDLVLEMVEQFVMQEHSAQNHSVKDHEFLEMCVGFTSDGSKVKVAKLVDEYLAEAAKDSSLPLSKFVELSEMVSSFPRSSHDGIYRAIDMYLKERSGLTKSEKKRICSLMDCSKLSVDACAHAMQNERLPLRVVMQILFFEQAKASGAGGGSSRAIFPGTSYGSSSSATTNTSDDWDGNQTYEELKTLRGRLQSLSLKGKGGGETDANAKAEKVADKKTVKRIFSKLWSNKDRKGENSSSDTSESPGSTSVEGTRSTPSIRKMQSP